MASRGEGTRSRILDVAHELVLARGFAATSIDLVVERAGVTKGAFFHHFRGKPALARALAERYAASEAALMGELFLEADRRAAGPRERLLAFVSLLADRMGAETIAPPGCLFASFAYEQDAFDPEIRALSRRSFAEGQAVVAARIRAVAAAHPPVAEVDADALAETFLAILEGGLVLARVHGDGRALGRQLRQFHDYLALLFPASA